MIEFNLFLMPFKALMAGKVFGNVSDFCDHDRI